MINMLRALMDKVDNMYEQMDNVSRAIRIQITKKKFYRSKNNVTEMKHAFDGLISRPATAEERIFELEDLSIETIKTEKQREQSGKNKQTNKTEQNIQGLWDNYKRCNICIMGIPEGEERNRTNI